MFNELGNIWTANGREFELFHTYTKAVETNEENKFVHTGAAQRRSGVFY